MRTRQDVSGSGPLLGGHCLRFSHSRSNDMLQTLWRGALRRRFLFLRQRRREPARPVSFRPWAEVLEDRLAPATFFVRNTNDSGPDSLRQVITDANAMPGLNTIDFNIDAWGANHQSALGATHHHKSSNHRRHQPTGLRRYAPDRARRHQRGRRRERADDHRR